jgi:16S rRNA (cytosine1402-N4)-methyltransferase
MRGHEPVLRDEVMTALGPHPGGIYIDGTVGAAGHARSVLELSNPDGRLLGIDLDKEALELAEQVLSVFGSRAALVWASFSRLGEVAQRCGFAPADGVFLDLGLSSMQLASAERGFSFQSDGPLDMRFDRESDVTAADLVNTWRADELADVLYRFGEERLSRRIARAIVEARPLRTTAELANVVARAVGRRGRIHPATKTFQALRIAVNGELEALEQGLAQAVNVLAPGGRLAVIAFHSLEDRIVKRYFQERSRTSEGQTAPVLRLVTRHPIQPTWAEQERNPRSRSAKLRVAERSS